MQSVNSSQQALHSIFFSFQRQEPVRIYPQGTSMLPLLKQQRDSVIISPIANHSIRKGEILLYQRENGLLILHRLCRIRKGKFYFAGDNQTALEGPISSQQVIGIVTQITRKGHTFCTTSIQYRIYVALWLFTRPIRPYIAKIVKKIYPDIDKI